MKHSQQNQSEVHAKQDSLNSLWSLTERALKISRHFVSEACSCTCSPCTARLSISSWDALVWLRLIGSCSCSWRRVLVLAPSCACMKAQEPFLHQLTTEQQRAESSEQYTPIVTPILSCDKACHKVACLSTTKTSGMLAAILLSQCTPEYHSTCSPELYGLGSDGAGVPAEGPDGV